MTEVTVLLVAREEGQAVNMACCTCPAAQDTHTEGGGQKKENLTKKVEASENGD